jgi:DNA repair photolyase
LLIIYEPKGKAREYAPLALNLYTQCGHGCLYCYAPRALRKPEQGEYFAKNAAPRSYSLKELEASIRRYQDTTDKYIHLSFVGDPYDRTRKDNAPIRQALELCLKYRVPVQILTKGGARCLIDLDLFKAFNGSIRVGQSLTFWDPILSAFFEPFAASPEERLETLDALKDEGVSTWASFEPVIELSQSLMLLTECLEYDLCDYYTIGTISGTNQPDVDWEVFLDLARRFIKRHKAKAYFKQALRDRAPIAARELTKEQTDMNAYPVPPFSKTSQPNRYNGGNNGNLSNDDDFPLPDKTQDNYCDCNGCQ